MEGFVSIPTYVYDYTSEGDWSWVKEGMFGIMPFYHPKSEFQRLRLHFNKPSKFQVEIIFIILNNTSIQARLALKKRINKCKDFIVLYTGNKEKDFARLRADLPYDKREKIIWINGNNWDELSTLLISTFSDKTLP